MSTDQKNNEEEVDLGSLFVIIGRGFSNLFNFIKGIFTGILTTALLYLISRMFSDWLIPWFRNIKYI
mgnify:CR=1 FL=1